METHVYPLACEQCHLKCQSLKTWVEMMNCISQTVVQLAFEYLIHATERVPENELQERVSLLAWRVMVVLLKEDDKYHHENDHQFLFQGSNGCDLFRLLVKLRWNVQSMPLAVDLKPVMSILLDSHPVQDSVRHLTSHVLELSLKHSWNINHWVQILSKSLELAMEMKIEHQDIVYESVKTTLAILHQIVPLSSEQDLSILNSGIHEYIKLFYQKQESAKPNGRRASQIFTEKEFQVQKTTCCTIQ